MPKIIQNILLNASKIQLSYEIKETEHHSRKPVKCNHFTLLKMRHNIVKFTTRSLKEIYIFFKIRFESSLFP